MRIAITGATGLLGSHLALCAQAHGHDVVAVVRNPDKARWLAERGVAREEDVFIAFAPAIVSGEGASRAWRKAYGSRDAKGGRLAIGNRFDRAAGDKARIARAFLPGCIGRRTGASQRTSRQDERSCDRQR